MIKDVNPEKVKLTPIVNSLKGSFSSSKNFDNKKELVKSLANKYLYRIE
jgi:hypothetical protein